MATDSMAQLVLRQKMKQEKHLGLRIDFETHEKLKSLAEYEGRSINGEVLYLIRQAIAQSIVSIHRTCCIEIILALVLYHQIHSPIL